ncbi:phosphoribosylglycinamide formyltransferase [Pseudotenacibaculum sp. MALMAid0570]|mgnify:CR=1 FL=1|uniref:phosphoribosylglycinamide formyltransferase n=1 Tax=Pseudotenacibaculum sp. MALMAid0570 TaxID=3143938 RepID=UPI0032DE7894
MKRIAIFASGSGTNAENIIKYFQNSDSIRVSKVYCNKKEAGVFERCQRLNVPCVWFSREAFYDSSRVLHDVQLHADFLVLAGFLWKIPQDFIAAFSDKMVNIHPALLPKYGGKGMYGMNVHKAVKENRESETGITIHYVNEDYDEGAIIFQAKTNIDSQDSPEDIANKIHVLEYEHFPIVIEETILTSDK